MRMKLKRMLSLFVAVVLLFTSLGIQNMEVKADETDTNLVQGKTVTASSVESGMPGNTADMVADGSTSTRWSSNKMKESGISDADAQIAQWLVIDLGEGEYDISEIKVSFFKKVWATKYQIQTADTNTTETEWQTVKAVDRASGSLSDDPVDTFTDVVSLKRYIRFYFEKINVNAGGTGVSVTEIAIRGTLAEAEPTNVALGKTATASSVESGMPGNTADKTVDGSTDTRWSCNAMKQSGATDATPQTAQWLTLDLVAEETKVTEIQIAFHMKVWATKYQIQTADTNTAETEWTTVKEIDRASGSLSDNPVDTFTDVTLLKRYVRFYFEKVNVNAGGTGVSVKEITIMGTQNGSVSPEIPEQPKDPDDELEPTYTYDFTTGQAGGMETLYGSSNGIQATAEGLKLTYSATRAGVVDKAMAPISDGIFVAKIVPQENGARFGLIMRATDVNHKVLIGTENNNTNWFWEYWGDNGNKWGSTVAGPALTVGTEHTIKVKLVGKQVTLWVDGTEVFSQTMSGTPQMGAGYFGFDKCNSAGAYLIKSIKVTELNSASGELYKINELPAIGVNDTEVTLPEVKEGYKLEVIGSSKEQIISNNGKITPFAIGEQEVKLIVKITNEADEADTARRSFTVTVPAKNSVYPELFEEVTGPNAKPKVIPSLQEWYGYNGSFTLSSDAKIVINDAAGVGLLAVAENMQSDIAEICGFTLPIENGTSAGDGDIYIESLAADRYGTGKEGYLMVTSQDGIKIYSSTYTGCLYGTITVEQILWQDDEHKSVPCGVTRDYPDYEIRGIMFDVGRIPHRLQYLKDYTKILTWYKLNEFHLHLNDDFDYNTDGLSTKENAAWTGVHRLESDTFPSLTDKNVYSGEKFDYFNNEYADPFYTKDEYRALEALANSRGIDLIAEFDTPSHSTAYVEYAKENPDNIDWLGEINTTTSSAANNRQMLALDVNSTNATEKQHALNARRFIEELYDDYLGGDNPTFKSDTVHVGADEYWDKSNPEAFRGYVNFLSDLMASYGKTARMWGAQLLFPGNTKISPENIVLDIWATYEDDPIARLEEGYRVVSVPQPYLYTTPGRDHKDMVVEEYLYKSWDPVIFNGDVRAEEGEPLFLGIKAALWGDEFREGITEADTHERMLRAAAMVAEKAWGGQEEEDSYIDYQMAFEELKEGPGTQIAHNIKSASETVADYDLTKTETTVEGIVVKDASGNGYDAVVKNGTIVEVDGEAMIQFDGDTLMTTPLTTLDYPYTVSFDVKASEGNTKDSLLFAGYDGQLRVKGISDNEMTIKRSFYTQATGYEIPTDKVVNVTIVGTFQNTKIYVDGTLVKMLASADNGVGTDYWSTFVFPMEEIGENFHGYLGNIKAYNKALQPEMIADAAGLEEINVALNAEAYAERFGGSPALNTGDLKRHPAWKATDGDVSDPNTYWLSSNNNGDYLMIDLGETKTVNKVAVTWNGTQYATAFNVEVSTDGKDWTVAKAITGNAEAKNVITLDTPVEAQFVKIQGVTRNANYYGIKEVEVFETVDKTALAAAIEKAADLASKENLADSNLAEAAAVLKAIAAAEKQMDNPFTTTADADATALVVANAVEKYQLAVSGGIGEKLAGYTLSLEGNIGVNFHMQLSDEVLNDDDAYMNFTLGGKNYLQIPVKGVEPTIINGKECYVFKCTVPVKDMDTEITAQIVLSEDRKGSVYTYTVKDYADEITQSGGNYSEEVIELVEAMSDFGDYATAYFTDGNAGATPELPELTEEDLGYLATMQAKIADDKDSIYYGSSLLLKSDTILRHYFTEKVPGSTQKGDLYYIDSEGIPAHELGKERVTEVGDIEITYNPLSYAYIALTREGIEESLTSLMCAMYQYHQAAQAYLEATPN